MTCLDSLDADVKEPVGPGREQLEHSSADKLIVRANNHPVEGLVCVLNEEVDDLTGVVPDGTVKGDAVGHVVDEGCVQPIGPDLRRIYLIDGGTLAVRARTTQLARSRPSIM